MIPSNISRKAFIRNIAVLSMVIGINPSQLFSANGISSEEISPDLADDIRRDYENFLRQTLNSSTIDSVSQQEAERQYNAMLKLLCVTADPSFKSASVSKQIKRIADAKPAAPGTKITKKERERYLKELMMSGEMMFDASAFAYGATGAVVGTSIKVLNLARPAYKVILEIPRWIKISSAIFGGAVALRRSWREFEFRVKESVSVGSQSLNTTVYDRYLKETTFRFENIPDFSLQVSSSPNAASSLSRGARDQDLANLLSWFKSNVGDGAIFTDRKELEKFLDGYILQIGGIQEKSLVKVLEAQQKKDMAELALQRDKAALFQSVQNFVGTVILGQLKDRKTAEVLNTLMSVGFQLAMGASMGPIGIAAVGISIAATLLSKDNNNGFQEALFKMLKQIQRQLDIITEKIDILHKNQIEIINQLNHIIEKIERIEDLLVEKFADIKAMDKLIYQTNRAGTKQSIADDFSELNARLKDAVRDDNQSDIYRNLQEIRGIARRLDNTDFTGFINGDFDGTELKKQIYFNNAFRFNICLYDTIGLISALAGFDPVMNNGTNNIPVLHPIEFFAASNVTVDWLIAAGLSRAKAEDLCRDLLKSANTSKKAINDAAGMEVVLKKSQSYLSSGYALLTDIYTYLKSLETSDMKIQDQLAPKYRLSPDSPDLSPMVVEQHDTSVSQFMDNRNDLPLLNLMTELGIVENVKTVSQMNFVGQKEYRFVNQYPTADQPDPAFKKGGVIQQKNNEIIFKNAVLDSKLNLRFSFNIPYTRERRIETYTNKTKSWSCGHDGNNDCLIITRTVTSSSVHTVIDPSWKKTISDELSKRNIPLNDVFPDWNNMDYYRFLQLIVHNWSKDLRSTHSLKLRQYCTDARSSRFDGNGTALMVLSKLNTLVRSTDLVLTAIDGNDCVNSLSYVIDYGDELFVREDILSRVEAIAQSDLNTDGGRLYRDIMDRSRIPVDEQNRNLSPFYLKDSLGRLIQLNPLSFADLTIIILKEKMNETSAGCVNISRPLTDSDCEPFLSQAISKLEWFLSTD